MVTVKWTLAVLAILKFLLQIHLSSSTIADEMSVSITAADSLIELKPEDDTMIHEELGLFSADLAKSFMADHTRQKRGVKNSP